MSLRDINIFKLTTILTDFCPKLSSVGEYGDAFEVLVVVQENSEILFRRTDKFTGNVVLRLLCWFNDTGRNVQDVCFQPAMGPNVLILCSDNTLHTVSLAKLFEEDLQPHAEIICSYIIPFIGPHECPNAKTCPNNYENNSNRSSISFRSGTDGGGSDAFSAKKIDEFMKRNSIMSTLCLDTDTEGEEKQPGPQELEGSDVEVISSDVTEAALPDEDGVESLKKLSKESTFEETKTFSTSLESSSYPCPYPCCCLWWNTLTNENRAIIGYSDGTICFVGLSPNCPFIANTSVEKGMVEKLVVCKDSSLEIISLMITTSLNEQWKLLLEQKSIGYIFPGDSNNINMEGSGTSKDSENAEKNSNESVEDDWQLVIPLNEENQPLQSTSQSDIGPTLKDENPTGILPSMARLATLGAKKIGALKMKVFESRLRSLEKATKFKNEMNTSLAIMDTPGQYPEILTTPSGPFFSVQMINEKTHLAALHAYSDTLSVHSMDITLIPLFLYKLHKNCKNILLTTNLIYTIQNLEGDESVPGSATNAEPSCQPADDNKTSEDVISTATPSTATTATSSNTTVSDLNDSSVLNIISCRMAAMEIGDECEFNQKSHLAQFKFAPNERIISIHRRTVPRNEELMAELNNVDKDLPPEIPPPRKSERRDFYYLRDYNNMKPRLEETENFDITDVRVMSNKFPSIEFESCFVVTNKNIYTVDFSDHPHIMFLNLANAGSWPHCEDFCTTFNILLPQCIEFAGDVFLKRQKVTQALNTFNVARIPPIYTARKFALFCECNALMQLCATGLKVSYLLKSQYPAHYHIEELLRTANNRIELYSKNTIEIPPISTKCVLNGASCSDFNYSMDVTNVDAKISNTSLFHLSNYLLLTLCEKSIRDRQFMPLWNFVATNTRYHSYLASVVLCESGLYSAAILLAKVRGIALTVFYCLVKVGHLDPDEYFDIGVLMYNLSEDIFMEAIGYLYTVSHDYFEVVKKWIDDLDIRVVERLERQLNPFDPIYRPLIMKISDLYAHGDENDVYRREYIDWYRNFIETYIIVAIRLKTLRGVKSNFLSALSSFQIKYEEELTGSNFDYSERFAAGFSYGMAVVNRCAFMWGYNGIHPVFDVKALDLDKSEPVHIPKELTFFAALSLDVLAVKCGRSHFLLLTTSGLYSVGLNNLGQLGIGLHMSQSPHPVLIRSFEGKKITQISAGQYHNAVVADGQLYTWGWNIFGQLGHGNIEQQVVPKKVEFFVGKKILQVQLGYSHSLVLCENSELFVFGSNHFGQLGIGQYMPSWMAEKSGYLRCPLKHVASPTLLDMDGERIRLVHTRYFSNLLVTESNILYTWGLSPQSLRLATQAKKRAKQSLAEKAKAESESSMKVTTTTTLDTDNEADGFKGVKEEIDVGENVPKITVTAAPTVEELKTAESFEESTDHYNLMAVDTSDLESDIIELSSGLYHYALITAKYDLYTWGKNLERQLGLDGPRGDVLKPTRLDAIENPLHVHCGGDFTLVMTSDYQIKAFGNNNSAQCGVKVSLKDSSGRLVRLRVSKRLVRIPDDSQYIQEPVTVQLPPQIDDQPAIVYLKSIPSFECDYIQRCELRQTLLELETFFATIDSNLNELCDENVVGNLGAVDNKPTKDANNDNNVHTPEECCGDQTESPTFRLEKNKTSPKGEDSLNDKIHYCLFIFNGLYDHNNIIKSIPSSQHEYEIRMHMLDFKFIDAFKLALVACENSTPQKCLKIFEYFTKDSSIFPMHTDDLKYFIYEIFMHFIARKYALHVLEEFFMADLDIYLPHLAYVLYFNNNNSDLERSVLQKYRHLFTDQHNHNHRMSMMDSCEVIFKSVSTRFTVQICQKIIEKGASGENDNDF